MSEENIQGAPEQEPDEISQWAAKIDVDNEEEVIRYANSIRHELTESFKTYAVAGDTKAGNLIRGLVGDMTKDIFTGRKIKVEDKNADTNAQFAREFAAMMDENDQRVKRHDNKAGDTAGDMPDFDVSEMPELELPEGLVSQGTPEVDIDRIVSEGLAKSGRGSEDED